MTTATDEYWEKTVEWHFVRHHLPSSAVAAPLDGDKEAASDALLSFGDPTKWLLIEFKRDLDSISKEADKYPALGKEIVSPKHWPARHHDSVSAYNHLIKKYSAHFTQTPHLMIFGEMETITITPAVSAQSPIVNLADGNNAGSPEFKQFFQIIRGMARSLTEKTISKNYLKLHARSYWGDDWTNSPKRAPGALQCTAQAKKISMEFIKNYQAEKKAFNKYLSLLLLAKGKNPGDSDFDYSAVVAISGAGFQVVSLYDYCASNRAELDDFWNKHIAIKNSGNAQKITKPHGGKTL